jgi:hypothetical protein
MKKLKCGLIQMAFKGDMSMDPEQIRDVMIDAHIPYIEDAVFPGSIHAAVFLSEPGSQVVRGGRAYTGWPYGQAHAEVREEAQNGYRRAHL